MDNLDQKIIEELTEDGRKPFMAIAKKLGASTQTIIRRYNEMKANKTITLLTIQISLTKIGYAGTAHILIKTGGQADQMELLERLRKTQDIIIATRTIGAYDAYAVLAFKTVNDLYKKVVKIKELPGVLTIDTSFSIPGIHQFPPQQEIIN